MTEVRPPDWDWVTERANCSIVVMFERLRDLARRDMDTRNQQLRSNLFHFGEAEETNVRERAFTVMNTVTTDRIDFGRGDDSIEMRRRRAGRETGPAVIATLTLTDQAGCKFVVDGKELDAWQVLKRVLEPVLFA